MQKRLLCCGLCLSFLFGDKLVCLAALSKYFYICSLSNKPRITFNSTESDDGSIVYKKIDSTTRLLRAQNKSHRSDVENLHSHSFADTVHIEEFRFTSEVPAIRSLVENDSVISEKSSRVVEVRECPCVPHVTYGIRQNYYCETNQGYCAIPGSYQARDSEPVCLNIQNDEIFVRSVWPIILIWFALTLVFCSCTWAGRNATDFVISMGFPSWNKYIFEAICNQSSRTQREAPMENSNNARDAQRSPLGRNENSDGIFNNGPETSQRGNNSSCLQQIVYRRRTHFKNRYQGIVHRARMRGEGVHNSTSDGGFEYEIPTRRFKCDKQLVNTQQSRQATQEFGDGLRFGFGETSANDDESEDEDPACAICHEAFEDGDRVTETECNHVFHVACLKDWLTRRNVCPLCMQEGVAKPKQPRQDVFET